MGKTFSSKHKDSLKLLFGDKKVAKKVQEIRAFLNVPEEMYDPELKTNKNTLAEKWNMDLYNRTDEIVNSEKYKNSIQKIRNDLKENKVTLKMAQEMDRLINNILPFNYLSNNIEKIISEYNLPKSYEMSIRTYIICGEMSWMTPHTFSVNSHSKNKGYVTLNIYHKLTDEDLAEIKEAVNKIFGRNLPPVIKSIKDIDTKLATERYHNDRQYLDHVTGKKVTVSAKEIVANVKADTKKKIKPADVYDIPRQLKKIRERRFKKSGTK